MTKGSLVEPARRSPCPTLTVATLTFSFFLPTMFPVIVIGVQNNLWNFVRGPFQMRWQGLLGDYVRVHPYGHWEGREPLAIRRPFGSWRMLPYIEVSEGRLRPDLLMSF